MYKARKPKLEYTSLLGACFIFLMKTVNCRCIIERITVISDSSVCKVLLHWQAELLVIFVTHFAIYFRLLKLSINKIIAIKFRLKINGTKLVLYAIILKNACYKYILIRYIILIEFSLAFFTLPFNDLMTITEV